MLGRPVLDRNRNHVEMLAEQDLALPALAPAEMPEARDWPFYEARVSVHVRPTKPTDAFGEGGDELAHARAWTQAPDFASAVERLDADLAKNWSQILTNAPLVDQKPSPEVLPKPVPLWRRRVEVSWGALAFVVFVLVMQMVALGLAR